MIKLYFILRPEIFHPKSQVESRSNTDQMPVQQSRSEALPSVIPHHSIVSGYFYTNEKLERSSNYLVVLNMVLMIESCRIGFCQ